MKTNLSDFLTMNRSVTSVDHGRRVGHKTMTRMSTASALAAVVAALSMSAASAATDTDTFGVSATVEASCVIQSSGALGFGTVGALTTAVEATSDITVKCTNGTTYDVGLDAGATTGATVTARQMEGATATVEFLDYSLYSDSGRTTNWGDTVDTDTVAGTGTGASVVHTVYGRIPAQDAPKVDTYSDTITVTVTY